MFGLSNMLTYFYICAFIGFVFAMSDDPQTGVKVIKARRDKLEKGSAGMLINDLYDTCFAFNNTAKYPEMFITYSEQILDRIRKYKKALEMKTKIVEQFELLLEATGDQIEYQAVYDAMLSFSEDMCTKQDCSSEILPRSTGVYPVYIEGNPGVKVLCNMDVDGGNWTVIQKRQDGSVDFFRTWQEYKEGFGDLEGEFWLGNENIHKLTSSGRYELRVDLRDWEGNSWYAVYSEFKISNEHDKYRLSVGGYKGTAGDSLGYHNHGKFSTKDQDNDNSSRSCSNGNKGAWWYKSCHHSNLNGLYQKGDGNDRVTWRHAKNKNFSMKFARMMIRRY